LQSINVNDDDVNKYAIQAAALVNGIATAYNIGLKGICDLIAMN